MSHFVLASYRRELLRLDYTRKRMEMLFQNKKIKLKDIHFVYEALFLRALTGFEQFCETLFFEIMNRRIRYSRRKLEPKIKQASERSMREIVLQGRKYLDWLPFEEYSVKRANLYLNAVGTPNICGRPFFELERPQADQLGRILIIRNAIAHRSSHAMKQFNDKVVSNQPLLTSQRSPAGFLRTVTSSTPHQTRFEAYVGDLASIAATVIGKPLKR